MPNLQAWLEKQIRDHSPGPGRPESHARAVLDACVALSGRGGIAFGLFLPFGGYPEAQRLYQLSSECLGDWLPSIQDQELLDELFREIARHDLDIAVPPALAAKTTSRGAEPHSLDEVRWRTDTDHPILGPLTWNEPWLAASVASRCGHVELVMQVTHQDDVDTLLSNAVRIFKSSTVSQITRLPSQRPICSKPSMAGTVRMVTFNQAMIAAALASCWLGTPS